jgi:hypothetical protein
LLSTNPHSPDLEDIPEEEKNIYPFYFYEKSLPERHLPIKGPFTMLGIFNPKELGDP